MDEEIRSLKFNWQNMVMTRDTGAILGLKVNKRIFRFTPGRAGYQY